MIEGIKKLKCDLSSGKHIDNNHVFINLYKSKAGMKKKETGPRVNTTISLPSDMHLRDTINVNNTIFD